MKITIVTICYNAATVIEETMLSVINQTYDNIEYIIIDGASSDNTMEIVNKYRDRISVVVSEPDKGIYDAMNKGIKLATGEWINFMNAGDCFCNCNVLSNIFENKTIEDDNVIYSSWYGKTNNSIRLRMPKPFWTSKGFRNMGFSHQTVFVPNFYAKKYLFDLKYKLVADYNMIWNLYYKEKLHFLQASCPICVMDEDGFTEHHIKTQIQEVCDICGILGLKKKIIVCYKTIVHYAKHKIRQLLS